MKNRTIGSIFIVAGTTIGAGMLAMPLSTAGVGFSVTLVTLISLWALMCYTALLLVEAYQYAKPGTGFGTLAKRYLGRFGHFITSFSMLFLMYALISAYISGGGELMTITISKLLDYAVPAHWGILLYTFIGCTIVTIGTHSVDIINRILFSLKFVFLFLVLWVMMPNIEYQNLLSMPLHQGLVVSSIPILFTSFGFHGSIPSIVQYLNYDVKKLRKVFILGSLLPLVTYITWQLTIMGNIAPNSLIAQTGLNSLLVTVHQVVNNPWVVTALHRFADLALATSFLGVALGLFDYLADLFKRSNQTGGRIQSGLLTFTPPLVFALFYPKGFQMALGYAAIALAVLALLLPSMLAWKTRQLHPEGYQVPGGKPLLIGVFCFGICVISIELAIIFGCL